MVKLHSRTWRRLLVAVSAIALVALATTPVLAAKPESKPAGKPEIRLKVSAITSVFAATVSYQVNVPASAIASQTCYFFGQIGVQEPCDETPNQGSGTKLTKYSLDFSGLQWAGDYRFEVDMSLTSGAQITGSITFPIAPGPAVRFQVTGLVAQPSECYVGINCTGFPPADYPRQIAKITALDSYGNVATGYAGTVQFTNPVSHVTPADLVPMTLTNGIGYVPVLVPSLGLGYYEEPFSSSCPSGITGNGVVLTVTDTLNSSIFGCQNIPGGDLSIVFPAGFFDAVSAECPSGCFSEPTGNFTVNTNTIPLEILTPNLYLTDPGIALTGASLNDHYFTEPITVSSITIEGASISITNLAQCILCTTGMNYYADSVTNIDIGSTVTIVNNSDINFTGDVTLPWSTIPTTVEIIAPTTSASTPTCYEDVQLVIAVDLDACN